MRTNQLSRSVRVAFVTGLVGLLAACTTPEPTFPLLTPIQTAKSFGYSEEIQADNKVEVTYVTPTTQAYGFRYSASPAEKDGKDLGFDLAVWRASQIAQARGFLGFKVLESHFNVDAFTANGYYDPGPFFFAHTGFRTRRGFFGGGFSDGFYEPPQRTVQVQAKVNVQLTNELSPGDYNAAESLAQLHVRYPNGDGLSPTAKPATSK